LGVLQTFGGMVLLSYLVIRFFAAPYFGETEKYVPNRAEKMRRCPYLASRRDQTAWWSKPENKLGMIELHFGVTKYVSPLPSFKVLWLICWGVVTRPQTNFHSSPSVTMGRN